jgi:hypothetical protein
MLELGMLFVTGNDIRSAIWRSFRCCSDDVKGANSNVVIKKLKNVLSKSENLT